MGCCPDRGFRLPLAARAGAHPMIAVAELSGPRFQRKAERQKPTQENDIRMNPNIPNDTNYYQADRTAVAERMMVEVHT
jgi:hypothetical protein